MHTERAPPVEEIPRTIVDLILKLCPQESRDKLAISESQVLTINAKEALLARQVAGHDPSEAVQKEYSKIVFGKKWPNRTLDELRREVDTSLHDSHMLEFEEKVLSFLRQNSWNIFLDSILHMLQPCLAELRNYLSTTISALTMDRTQLAQRAEMLLHSVSLILTKFHLAEVEADRTKDKMIQQIQEEFAEVSKSIRSTVELACAAEAVEGGKTTKLLRVLLCAENVNASKSPLDIAEHVEKVNRAVSQVIQDEFATARRRLEVLAAERLHALCVNLKEIVQPLVVEVEATVKQNIPLNFSFKDFHLEVSPPTEAELHKTVANLAEFIQEKSEVAIREEQVEEPGMCGTKWLKWERKHVLVHSYSFNKDDLVKKWCTEADRLAARFANSAARMAKQQFDATVQETKNELRRYSQLLLDAAESARKTHNQGEAATKRRILHLASQAKVICNIMCDLVDIRVKIVEGYRGVQIPSTKTPAEGLYPIMVGTMGEIII